MDSKYPFDWNKRRRVVFRRDEWECRGCGFVPQEQTGEGLHAHHVKPISEGGGHSLNNLITLCEDCHYEVHSSRDSPPLTPVETHPCAECDCEYAVGEAFKGSFCTERCWLVHKADKAINAVRNNNKICSTCFSNFPSGAEVCPNCGNWDSAKNHRDTIGDVEVNVQNLVAVLIKNERLG